MALMLARSLVEQGTYDTEQVLERYRYWMGSNPFDFGRTTYNGLIDRHDLKSQANGALMRISPPGIYGSKHDLEDVAEWARQDARLPTLIPSASNSTPFMPPPETIPQRWIDTLLICAPQAGLPGVNRPRPECFWPSDVLELAEQLDVQLQEVRVLWSTRQAGFFSLRLSPGCLNKKTAFRRLQKVV